MLSQPIVQDLVLVGGGHSHAIALRMFAMNPIPDLRLTVISDVAHTPYSGMLPGHVAGFYSYDDCHIDLRPLANFAGARLFVDRVVGLDLAAKRVLCANRPPVAFDLLSINIGSSPSMAGVPGAADWAIPAKPVPQFLHHWQQLLQEIEAHPPAKPLVLGIVGGGVGGVELALAMQRRLQSLAHDIKIHLFHSGKELLPNHSRYIQYKIQKILLEKGIELHLGTRVVALESGSGGEILVQGDSKVRVQRVFWVTQASAPAWIKESGLAVDGDGFIEVRDTLQSVSHNDVFAAGDIATIVNNPRPKAGVFAVRQGKPLFENLRRVILGQPLQKFTPQRHFLALIGTGTGEALASRGVPGIGPIGIGPSRRLWRWKDWIDRRFMAQFSQLPEMSAARSPQPSFKRRAEESPNPLQKGGC
ncbi:FAD-dependent oxidoreductase [[Phormidium] sp. ETS-05]|uniref:FAD-dependent oxidoreductase n=1 Tax=[Phormidium] sp. ETS-05 TaxID=222819 RepID=UPI0018EEFC6E|nr:FAD-dependent oxidoreductase [[Phormidium] sp. ETS-05]